MAVVVQSFEYALAGGLTATSVTVNKPTGVAVGDLLILLVGNEDNTATTSFAAKTGWTKQYEYGNATPDTKIGCYTRIADGTEGTSETISWNATGADAGGAWYLRVTGHDPVAYWDTLGTSSQTASASSQAAASITPTVAGCLVFAHHSFDGGDGTRSVSGTNWPSSFPTNQVLYDTTAGTAWSGGWVTQLQTSAVPSNNCTFASSTADGMVQVQFAIAPSGTQPVSSTLDFSWDEGGHIDQDLTFSWDEESNNVTLELIGQAAVESSASHTFNPVSGTWPSSSKAILAISSLVGNAGPIDSTISGGFCSSWTLLGSYWVNDDLTSTVYTEFWISNATLNPSSDLTVQCNIDSGTIIASSVAVIKIDNFQNYSSLVSARDPATSFPSVGAVNTGDKVLASIAIMSLTEAASVDPTDYEESLQHYEGANLESFVGVEYTDNTPSITITGLSTTVAAQAFLIRSSAFTSISKDLTFSWDEDGHIDQDLTFSWNEDGHINQDLTFSWNELTSVTNDLTLSWNELEFVNQDLTFIWNEYIQITSDLVFTWDEREFVATDYTFTWNELVSVNNEITISWDELNSINQSLTFSWNELEVVQQDLTFSWDEEASASAVSSDLSFSWNELEFVQQDLTFSWNEESNDVPIEYNQQDSSTNGSFIIGDSGVTTNSATYVRDMEETGTGSNSVTVVNDKFENATINFYSPAVNETTWAGGTYSIPINVTTGLEGGVIEQVFVFRVNAAGTWQETLGSTTFSQSVEFTGVYTANVTGSATTALATDRLVILITSSQPEDGTLNWAFTPNQTITTPIIRTAGSTSVQQDLTFSWNELEFVQQDITFSWNELEFVQQDLTFSWNELEFVQQDLVFSWNELEFVQQDLTFSWNELEFVQQDLAFSWDELASVQQDITFSWNELEFVQQDLVFSWNEETLDLRKVFINDTESLSGAIEQPWISWADDQIELGTIDLGSFTGTIYIAAQDANGVLSNWYADTVDLGLSAVFQDLTFTWNETSVVSSDLTFSWNELEFVQQDLTFSWNELEFISSDLTFTWDEAGEGIPASINFMTTFDKTSANTANLLAILEYNVALDEVLQSLKTTSSNTTILNQLAMLSDNTVDMATAVEFIVSLTQTQQAFRDTTASVNLENTLALIFNNLLSGQSSISIGNLLSQVVSVQKAAVSDIDISSTLSVSPISYKSTAVTSSFGITNTYEVSNYRALLAQMNIDVLLTESADITAILNSSATFSGTYTLGLVGESTGSLTASITFINSFGETQTAGLIGNAAATFVSSVNTSQVANKVTSDSITFTNTFEFSNNIARDANVAIEYLNTLDLSTVNTTGISGIITFVTSLVETTDIQGILNSTLTLISTLTETNDKSLIASKTSEFLLQLSEEYSILAGIGASIDFLASLAEVSSNTLDTQKTLTFILGLAEESNVYLDTYETIALLANLTGSYTNYKAVPALASFDTTLQESQVNLLSKLLTISIVAAFSQSSSTQIDAYALANIATTLTTFLVGDQLGNITAALDLGLALSQGNTNFNVGFAAVDISILLEQLSSAGRVFEVPVSLDLTLANSQIVDLIGNGVVNFTTTYAKVGTNRLIGRPNFGINLTLSDLNRADKSTLATTLLGIQQQFGAQSNKVVAAIVDYALTNSIDLEFTMTIEGTVVLTTELAKTETLQLLGQAGITFGNLLGLASLSSALREANLQYGTIVGMSTSGFRLQFQLVTPDGRKFKIHLEDRITIVDEEDRIIKIFGKRDEDIN